MLAQCRAEPASLLPVSQTAAFDAVAVGCTAHRDVVLDNVSSSWLRVQPAQPASARDAFTWPVAPVRLPPGHQLRLPVTFAPTREEAEVEARRLREVAAGGLPGCGWDVKPRNLRWS